MSDESDEAEVSIVSQESNEAYYSGVVQAARDAIAGGREAAGFHCLCAQCPAAHWTLSDAAGRLELDGPIVAHGETDAWEVRVFCRIGHEVLATFTPDYHDRRLKPVRGSRIISHCDSYVRELGEWARRIKK